MCHAFGIHPFERASSWHGPAGCYDGRMQKRNEVSRGDGCGVIACIVHAVRAGDDQLIAALLHRFAQHAEFEALFRLRAALDSDVGPAPQSSTRTAPLSVVSCRQTFE